MLRHIQKSFQGGVDEFAGFMDGSVKDLRNKLWLSMDPKHTQGLSKRQVAQYKRYMLERIHNRKSRVVPPLVIFVKSAGGMVCIVNVRCACHM